MYILGEWHVGREPKPLEVRTEFGWGWSRAALFIDRLWKWAGEAGATRPASPRVRPGKADEKGTGKESVSERGVIGESSVNDEVGAEPIVEADRGVIGESSVSQRGVSRARDPLLERKMKMEIIETPPKAPLPADAGCASPAPAPSVEVTPPAPALPSWVPKSTAPHPRAAVAGMVLAAVQALRGALVNPERCGTDAREVLGLWRALGCPDPAEWSAEVVCVIEAAQNSPHRLFARDIRAEGWPEGTDRRRSMATICRRDRWAERLDAAQAWRRGSVDVGASQVRPQPTVTGRRPTYAELVKSRKRPSNPNIIDIPETP